MTFNTRPRSDLERIERRVNVGFWTAGLMLGAAQAWIARQRLSSDDAIAYLDIGDAYFRGDWHGAINAYWSPLYSWLLGAAMALFHPQARWEFPLVKLVNFVVFAATFGAFEILLREIIAHAERSTGERDVLAVVPRWVWRASGYAMFLWVSLVLTGVSSDTPDMLVAALFYVATAIVLRMQVRTTPRDYVALGGVLGIGYLAKTAMFPLAIVFFAVAMFSGSGRRQRTKYALLGLAVFILFAAPFVVAISSAKGRPTFGDTGKLNYAWVVTRYVRPFRFWEGREPMAGIPKHAPRELSRRPEVFEFSEPVAGTYPPWHDPSYWYDGVKTRFRFAGQASASLANAVFYFTTFAGWFVVGWFAMVGFGPDMRRSFAALARTWPISIPALAGLGLYFVSTDMASMNIPTQPSGRFIAASVVVLFLALLSSVRRTEAALAQRRVGAVGGLAAAIVGIVIARDMGARVRDSRSVEGKVAAAQVEVAAALMKQGIRPGDRVAISGAYIFPYYHWARLARVKIVGEIHQDVLFWDQHADAQAIILQRLRQAGATAVVQRPGSMRMDESVWSRADDGYFVRHLRSGP